MKNLKRWRNEAVQWCGISACRCVPLNTSTSIKIYLFTVKMCLKIIVGVVIVLITSATVWVRFIWTVCAFILLKLCYVGGIVIYFYLKLHGGYCLFLNFIDKYTKYHSVKAVWFYLPNSIRFIFSTNVLCLHCNLQQSYNKY